MNNLGVFFFKELVQMLMELPKSIVSSRSNISKLTLVAEILQIQTKLPRVVRK